MTELTQEQIDNCKVLWQTLHDKNTPEFNLNLLGKYFSSDYACGSRACVGGDTYLRLHPEYVDSPIDTFGYFSIDIESGLFVDWKCAFESNFGFHKINNDYSINIFGGKSLGTIQDRIDYMALALKERGVDVSEWNHG